MEVDYIIVGGGIAGCSLALELTSNGAAVALIDAPRQDASSQVAAGLLNPIVPKRVTPTWNAMPIFKNLATWYGNLEKKLRTSFFHPMPMVQVHASSEEAKMWRIHSEKEGVHEFVFPRESRAIHGIETPYGHSEIHYAGRLNVQEFCSATWNFLAEKKAVFQDEFSWSDMHITEIKNGKFRYKNIIANAIVFCEGTRVMQNPFFNRLPIICSWGDILQVTADLYLESPVIFKQKHWLVPTGNGTYMAGSNFFNEQGDTDEQRKEVMLIFEQLQKWYPVTELIGYKRGARPVVTDRRPIMGEHPEIKGMYIFNGLGTKGCSLVSWLSPIMAQHLIAKTALPDEVRVSRFASKF